MRFNDLVIAAVLFILLFAMNGFTQENWYPFRPETSARMQTDATSMVYRAFLAHEVWLTPATASTTAIGTLACGTGPITYTTGFNNPDVARALVLSGSNTSATDSTSVVTIYGLNRAGAAISEALIMPATTLTTSGSKAFAAVTSIVCPTAANSQTGVKIGTLDKLGLPYASDRTTVLSTWLNNVLEGTAPAVTRSGTALESNTLDLNSALNGTRVDVYFYW